MKNNAIFNKDLTKVAGKGLRVIFPLGIGGGKVSLGILGDLGGFLLAVLNIEDLSGRCWDASRCSEPQGGNSCCVNNQNIDRPAVKTPANCGHLVSLFSLGKWDFLFHFRSFYIGMAAKPLS